MPAELTAQVNHGALFVEFGGSAGYGSANLELGVTRQLRIRGGAGVAYIWPAFPVTASYLLGRGSSTFELGAGATFIKTPDQISKEPGLADFFEKIFFAEGQGTLTLMTGVAGWRYQPVHGALLRAVITPLYYHGDLAIWGGLSLGFSF